VEINTLADTVSPGEGQTDSELADIGVEVNTLAVTVSPGEGQTDSELAVWLDDVDCAESSQIGAVERSHRTCDSQLRALRLDVRGRTDQDVIPGHVMFPWMVRYGPFCLNRFQPRGQRGQTIFEGRNGYHYKSPLVPFLEQVVIRVPIDPPGYRKKLDSQWLKGDWVGRASDSDANVVVHPEGIVAGKSVRRLAPENRHNAELYKVISGPKAWKCGIEEPLLSMAKLLKLLPLSIPIRLDGETDIKVDGSLDMLIEDEPVEVEMAAGEGGENIGLDAARATGSSSAPAPATDSSSVYAPPTIRPESSAQDPIEPPTRRRRIANLRVSAISEMPDPSVRTEENIAESRKAHIDHLLESCSVKDWDVAELKQLELRY